MIAAALRCRFRPSRPARQDSGLSRQALRLIFGIGASSEERNTARDLLHLPRVEPFLLAVPSPSTSTASPEGMTTDTIGIGDHDIVRKHRNAAAADWLLPSGKQHSRSGWRRGYAGSPDRHARLRASHCGRARLRRSRCPTTPRFTIRATTMSPKVAASMVPRASAMATQPAGICFDGVAIDRQLSSQTRRAHPHAPE